MCSSDCFLDAMVDLKVVFPQFLLFAWKEASLLASFVWKCVEDLCIKACFFNACT